MLSKPINSGRDSVAICVIVFFACVDFFAIRLKQIFYHVKQNATKNDRLYSFHGRLEKYLFGGESE
ncbi:hypothetical protein P308_28930 [Pseudomonas piscis]|nr:hypothetical protein P308_28930 [Pseudomonas piscis]